MRVDEEDLVLVERGLPKHHVAPLWRRRCAVCRQWQAVRYWPAQIRSMTRCLSCAHHPFRTKRGAFSKRGLDARVGK